jgi:hypothetical protein
MMMVPIYEEGVLCTESLDSSRFFGRAINQPSHTANPPPTGPEPEEIAVVTFDTDRVSAEDVKKWMLLHKNSYFHTPMFGYYPDCKPGDIPKLEQEIKKNRADGERPPSI